MRPVGLPRLALAPRIVRQVRAVRRAQPKMYSNRIVCTFLDSPGDGPVLSVGPGIPESLPVEDFRRGAPGMPGQDGAEGSECGGMSRCATSATGHPVCPTAFCAAL